MPAFFGRKDVFLLSERNPFAVFHLENVQVHLRISVFVELELAGCAFEVLDLGQGIAEFLSVRGAAGFFSGFMHNVDGIVGLGGELVRFVAVFLLEGFAEMLCLFGLSFGVPWSCYQGAFSSGAGLFDISRLLNPLLPMIGCFMPISRAFLTMRAPSW